MDIERFRVALSMPLPTAAIDAPPAPTNPIDDIASDPGSLFRRNEPPQERDDKGQSSNEDRQEGDQRDSDGLDDPAIAAAAAHRPALHAGHDAKEAAPFAVEHHCRPTVSDMVRDVANRLLVATSAMDGHQEVRITLKHELLAGAEVRIAEAAGAVAITFIAPVKDIEVFISEHSRDIAALLGARLNREVRIEVTSGAAASGDGGGESQADGRHRRRVAFDDPQR
jgi:hypothetical protein